MSTPSDAGPELAALRSGASGTMINTIITCPVKPEQATKVFGDPFNADELEYMRMRDAKCGFIIDTRVDDAFRNGFVYANKNQQKEGDKYKPIIKKFWKFAMQFGWSIILHKDAITADLMKALPPNTKSLGIQGLHPWTQNDGGIARVDIDPKTGFPLTFWYRGARGTQGADIPIDAARCDIYTHGDETTSWQGYTAIGRSYDPALGLRLWLAQALRRQRDLPGARFLITGIDPTNAGKPVNTDVQDQIKKTFPGIDVVAVNGDVTKVQALPSPSDTGENTLVVTQANQDTAVGASVSQSDMTGSQAGAKLSTDADTATYFMTAKDIQAEAFPQISITYNKLGIEIEGFKSAAELPAEKKIDKAIALVGAYNNAAQELKSVLAETIQDFYKSEFGKEVTINVRQTPDPASDPAEAGSEAEGGKTPAKAGLLAKIKGAINRGKTQ